MKRLLPLLLALLLIASAVCLPSCGKRDEEKKEAAGEITITVEVINKAGEHKEHTVKTAKTNLGDALLEAKIAERDVGDFGLYIKAVDGEVADWDADQAYWALSKNGEYLMTGASDTPIADGEHYELTYTKG